MKSSMHDAPTASWDPREVKALIRDLWSLRTSMVKGKESLGPWLQHGDPAHADSANNLAHYLAMRASDLRTLQARLATLGLSSLGRSETHVLANLDKVLGILHGMAGLPWSPLQDDEPAGYHHGPSLLRQHAEALFGVRPPERDVRIMVTLPSEAVHDGVGHEPVPATKGRRAHPPPSPAPLPKPWCACARANASGSTMGALAGSCCAPA